MSVDVGWRFPSLDGADREGINDSLLQPFTGDHERYIARECIQNSVDRRVDKNKPVKVEFRRVSLNRSIFPGIDELSGVINSCLELDKSAKAQRELLAAKKAISQPQISTLIVRDSNTEGLNGSDDDEEGNWFKLVRATGTNAGAGVHGGSFGLGKGAPFAASAFRTVYYATFNLSKEVIFQGKTRLVSHISNGDMKRGVGHYGIRSPRKCSSIRDAAHIPSEFVRSEQGTDVIIPAYKAVSDDWQVGLIQSVLKSFWPAIFEQMLEVEIYEADELLVHINRDNLEEFLEKYNEEETDFAYYYYLARTNPDENGFFKEELNALGEVELYVRKGEGYPRKVEQMRAPHMVVSTEQYRGALLDPFAAVLICKDDQGNEFLKELEPPEHDKWDPARGDNPRISKRVLRELQQWVRAKLKSLSAATESETAEIPGLADYLDSLERDDKTPFGRMDTSDESTDEESPVERVAPLIETIPAKRSVAYSIQAVRTDAGPNEGQGEGGGGDGGDGGSGSGDDDPAGRRRTPRRSSIRMRNLGVTEGDDYTDFEVSLYSPKQFRGSLRIVAAGEEGSSPLHVSKANSLTGGVGYQLKKGRILKVSIEPDRPARLRIRIEGASRHYALGVEAYEDAA